MAVEKSCETCGYFAALKIPFERSDGAVIYGYCFKDGDKDYSPNMGKGYPVFLIGGAACKQYKRRRSVPAADDLSSAPEEIKQTILGNHQRLLEQEGNDG